MQNESENVIDTEATAIDDAQVINNPQTETVPAVQDTTARIVASNAMPAREQLEMLQELQELEADIEGLQEGTTAASKLLDKPLDVIDAWRTEITDKDELKSVVCFRVQLQETGEQHIVMQSATSIREKYANYFGKFKALGMQRVLKDYAFVESDKERAGNKAIILRRVAKSVGAPR